MCQLGATPYFGRMIRTASTLFTTLCLATALSVPAVGWTQTEAENAEETTLATVEGPLTREVLNSTRIALQEQGVRFQYGNFQFHPESGNMLGAEIHMVIDGVEYQEVFQFTSANCKLRIIKESGFRMEGC